MEQYEFDPPNQKYEIIMPESASHEEQRYRNAKYPPSQLSYESVDYEGEADYSDLIGSKMRQQLPRRRTVAFRHNGTKLPSMLRQMLWPYIIALVSASWMAFTTIFAFNCSLYRPFSQWLLPRRSEDSLLILNILSHGTLLLLGQLTSQAFEKVRWALASSPKGVPAYSFLGLSRATGLLGVLSLLIGGHGGFLSLDGHRLWGIQRVSLFLVNAIVGIALLSNISVMESWRPAEAININSAGLSAINTSIAADITASNVWFWIYSLLPSPNFVLPVAPTRCTLANNCESYYLAGSIYNVDPPKEAFTNHSEATIFIVDNSIGYLLEFYPPEPTDVLGSTAECGTYGVEAYAFHICLQQADKNLLAGLAYCPNNSTCMSDTTWTDQFNSFLKVSISKLPATVVYSRQNDSILSIVDVGTPEPANYTPSTFFPFFNVAGLNHSYRSDLGGMEWVVTQNDLSTPYDNDFILMAMIGIPVALFNDAAWYGDFPDENCNITGALAMPSYRLNISPASLYGFIAGSLLSFIWSVILLIICLKIQIPNSSQYPEIDFASKCIDSPGQSSVMTRLLYPLGNANSREIEDHLAEIRFFVGGSMSQSDSIQHIAITIDGASESPWTSGASNDDYL